MVLFLRLTEGYAKYAIHGQSKNCSRPHDQLPPSSTTGCGGGAGAGAAAAPQSSNPPATVEINN